MGVLSSLRAARRRRILDRFPIPDSLWSWALAEHPVFRWLDGADAVRLRELATVFLAEKRFYPVGGAVVDDETRVSIAAQACLPILGLDMDWYRGWTTIIVTPREYAARRRDVDAWGVVHESDDELAGEVFDLGPVVLSREDVEASGWGDGYNVVIHEMAHKLDYRDGSFDGCPPLHDGMDPEAWRSAFSGAYSDLQAKLERPASRRAGRRHRGMDPYAAFSPEEFFAVACEYFYEKPAFLRSVYPDVYDQLVRFFRRDPGRSGKAPDVRRKRGC